MFTKIKHYINTKKLILILPIFLIQFGCKQKEETPKTVDEQTMQSVETSGEKTSTNNTTNRENAIQNEKLSPDKKIVATVNGRPIYKENIEGRKVENVVFEEILYEDALIKGLDKQYEKQIEKYKKILILRGIRKEIRSTLPKENPTDKEIEDFYNQHESRYTKLKVVLLSVNNKNIAEKIHKSAIKGEDFEKISSDYSDSGVKVSPKAFFLTSNKNNYFNSFETGTVSDIINQENGNFLIYKIVDVVKLPPLRVKASIINSLLTQKKLQALRELAEKAKQEHDIKVEIIQQED